MPEEQDDWLVDLSDEATSGEVDQSDIDALLAGNDISSESIADESSDELDQSDIDSLFASDDSPGESVAGQSNEELAQDDIDSLLAGNDSPAESIADQTDELAQDDIDSLLSGTSAVDSNGPAEISPDQEEIDRLFSEIDEDSDGQDPFKAEEIEFDDLLSNETDDTFLSTGNEFSADEFDLDDDIPDFPLDDDEATVVASRNDGKSAQGEEAPGVLDTGTESTDAGEGKAPWGLPIPMPAIMQHRKNQAIAGGVLVALIALVFMLTNKSADPEITAGMSVENQTTPVVEQPAPPPPVAIVNTMPQVNDLMYTIESGDPTAVVLVAKDDDGDVLQYELLSQPQYGKLSGSIPNLVYTPAPGFPGEDRFDFRAYDGMDYSLPAIVTVSGAEITKIASLPAQKKGETKAINPRQLIVSANNFSYSLTGTEPFIIDWQNIWNDANYLPYSKQISVEIISPAQHGNIQKISDSVSQYLAQKYYGGKETIRYRFSLGKLKSKIRNISLNILPGNPAPEIKMPEMEQTYRPGEIVLLDASNSLDDNRKSLVFSWQQVAGPNVLLTPLNEEGSRVSFVAPSSFNTVQNPGPTMQLTVIDSSGKKDVKVIKIQTKSRYKSAIWGDVAASGY